MFLQQEKLKYFADSTVPEKTHGFVTYLWLVEKERCLTTEKKAEQYFKINWLRDQLGFVQGQTLEISF